MTFSDPVPLSAQARGRLLAALSARPRGLFTDVDGTISRIAPTPESAVLLPGLRELLVEARAAFDLVAAVSGRAATDAYRMVGVDGILYLGNHGMERLAPRDADSTPEIVPAAAPYRRAITATAQELGAILTPQFPGLRTELKGVTASIHVRNTDDPATAEAAVYTLAQEAARPHGLRVTRGKMVVELRPPVDVDKGRAVAEIILARGLRGTLYLGDDQTDIDAFRAIRRLTAEGACQGVAVAILHSEAPATLAAEADITLPSIEAVPAFLRWLLDHAA